jgi:pyoverdine/dityrosine biosynthesis protein Dit1
VHLAQIHQSVQQNQPLTLILPAFPAKSPNLAKVLGHTPDLGEELSLQFLQQICNRIKQMYAPGAQLLLCTDGRVFNDAVGIKEEHVTLYQNEMDHLIHRLKLDQIKVFNLDHVWPDHTFEQMRKE